ncbi:MAG: helix-turn-helix transcriptional regulator [Candidatus Fermentithermobacillus carboniphilus]|uniref:Helix-turn-helix transcriptional regulator n=1 Tax=Candidatus Fermentithermobacillus carboniphilus TaxID=3085328 RepID=A0AAT9L9M2_9FIRM|nr:MAG: helix-turn-helix transcriptional regulator [Candidatus Fermentithermobacillus carboniphilus]
MEFVRIGDKVISRQKLEDAIDEILSLRSKGLSQAEVAQKTGVDRTFISRLEGLGELRKGGSIALVGFPLSNCDEIRKVAAEEGVDFTLVMTDEERWAFVRERSGADLLNDLMRLIATVRKYEKVILIGSDKRLEIMKGLLDKGTEVSTIVIGRSPMTGDVYLNPQSLREVIREMRG